MKGLIQIQDQLIGANCVQSVNAREMYQALGLNKTHWSRWSKQNIVDNAFASEGQDYQGFAIMANGNETVDYACALDFAKKLAMQVKTAEGEAVRNYFLQCEKKAESLSIPDFTDPVIAARAWADEREERQTLQLENKQQSEKLEKMGNFFKSGMTIPQFGKMLNGVNCMKMNEFALDELGWLYNESRSGDNKRWRVRSGARDKYLAEDDTKIHSRGEDAFIKWTPVILKKGAQKLYDLYLNGELPMKKTWDGEFTHLKIGTTDLVAA